MKRPIARGERAFTFVENIIAVGIVLVGFAAIYAMNAQCVYFANSSRKTFNGFQALQDRMEQLRNCSWSQITDSSYIANSVLNTPGFDSGALGPITEVVTINAYPTAVSPAIQVSRTNGTVAVVSTNSAVANGDLVKIDLTVTWTQSLGKRSRSMAISTIWAEGSR